MKLPYKEGDWFAVPLPSGGYGCGVVARSSRKGKVIFGYFFGPRRSQVPELANLKDLKPDQAVLICRFGDLGLIDGSWPILGSLHDWLRELWPMPLFIRRSELSGRSWLVEYSDVDPQVFVGETVASHPANHLGRDSVFGAGSVEFTLDQALR